jgi:hypothetical protein
MKNSDIVVGEHYAYQRDPHSRALEVLVVHKHNRGRLEIRIVGGASLPPPDRIALPGAPPRYLGEVGEGRSSRIVGQWAEYISMARDVDAEWNLTRT